MIVLVAAATLTTSAIAYGFFSARGTGAGASATGTVKLGVGEPATTTCTYAGLSPGDLAGSSTCALSVNYTGSVPAFVSITVEVRSIAGSGGATLYDGSNTDGLTFSVSDGQTSFAVPTGPGLTGGSCPAGYTCWSSPDDLAAWYSGATSSLIFTNASPTVTWTVTPFFPASAGNQYQGASASLTLVAQAIQSEPTPLPAGCTTSTIGQSCPSSGAFTWG